MANELSRKNVLNMYTLILLSKDEPQGYDYDEIQKANIQVLLRCTEYVTLDLRTESDRSQIPTDIAVQRMYDAFIDELWQDVQRYMDEGRVDELKELVAVMAVNPLTPAITDYIKQRDGRDNGKYKQIQI